MRSVRPHAAMWWFQVRQLARNSYFVQLSVTAPMVFLLLKWLAARGGGTSLDRMAGWQAGIAGTWALTATACGIIGFQRYQGVLEQQALSPRGPVAVFLPVVLAGTGLGLLSMPISVLGSAVLGRPPQAQRPFLLLVALASVVVACSVSACVIASVFVISRRAIQYESLLVTPVWLLAGVVDTWNSLPGAVRPIAVLTPLTSAVEATRHAATGGGGILGWLLLSYGMSGVWLAGGWIALRVALRHAVVVGSLDLA